MGQNTDQKKLRIWTLFTEYLSVFSPNAGKYGPEKTLYLDTVHAVGVIIIRNISAFCKPGHTGFIGNVSIILIDKMDAFKDRPFSLPDEKIIEDRL